MTSVQKAYLEPEKGEHITCLFNPSELSISRSNSWEPDQVPGKGAPDLLFGGGQSGTLAMTLTLDTTAEGTSVAKHTDRLLGLMSIDPSLPGHDPDTNRGRPPWVRFHWGDLHSFKAILESLDITFTYFSSSGTPLRAKAVVALKQYEEEAKWGPQNPTSGTPNPHRLHQVQPGETLDRIAAARYGDSTRWRLIAGANGIVDPLALKAGTVLVIPKPEAATRG
jgi:LysM repeat protein